MEKWHRHLGVYGIYSQGEKLLVVQKTRGPYIHRYDLPGGSFDPNESVQDCLIRELQEEIGQTFEVGSQIGVYDYLVPWRNDQGTHVHHMAIYFKISLSGALPLQSVSADDTAGYKLIEWHLLNRENASPLVMDAVLYLQGKGLSSEMKRFDEWQIRNRFQA